MRKAPKHSLHASSSQTALSFASANRWSSAHSVAFPPCPGAHMLPVGSFAHQQPTGLLYKQYFDASPAQMNWKRNLTVYETGDKHSLPVACLGIIPPSRHRSTHCSSACENTFIHDLSYMKHSQNIFLQRPNSHWGCILTLWLSVHLMMCPAAQNFRFCSMFSQKIPKNTTKTEILSKNGR